MKFKYPLFLILFFSFSVLSFSQDLIIKKNGEQINAKVGEINKKQVKYSLPDDPDLKIYTVSKDSLKLIRYANRKEINFEVSKYARAFIGLNGGLSMPLGLFGSWNTTSSMNGASDGFHLNLNLGFYVFKNLGLCVNAGIMSHDYYGELSSNYYYSIYENYESGYLLAGPMYSFKFGKKLFLDTKLQGGILYFYAPDFSYYDSYSATFENFYTDPTYNLCASGELSLRWAFSKRIGLSLSAQILSARANVPYTSTSSTSSILYNSSFSQPVTTLNLGLGIVYLFKRKN